MTSRIEPPALTADLLARLVDEARPLVGLVVRDVAPIAGDGVLFRFGAPGEKELRARWLVVTASGRARAHLVAPHRGERGEPDAATAAFAVRLAAALEGATLRTLEQEPGERILRAAWTLASGAPATLVCELFGATPNLALLDEAGIVRVCRRVRTGSVPLAPGSPYRAPKPRQAGSARLDPAAPVPAPPRGAAEESSAGLPPWTALVAAAYGPLDRDAAASERARDLLGRARAELARVERRIADLERDLEAARKAPRERELADLLAANFARLRPGMTTIEVEDLYRDGRVELDLDPALPPHENVARRYRRLEKLERSVPHSVARLAAARDRKAALEAVIAAGERAVCDAASLPDALAAAATVGLSTGAPAPSSERARRDAPADPGIRRFILRTGAIVLVGKDDADNDRLTHRIAKSQDVWLHVEGFPGSHVILRVGRGKSASLEDLLDAARLAVHFSKRRGAARATVTWAPKKYVRKGRGKPGLAIVERGKVLVVDHDPARLSALLSPPGSTPG